MEIVQNTESKNIKCSECGRVFDAGNDDNGLPNGIGFVLEDNSVVNICTKCIMNMSVDAFTEITQKYNK